MKSSQSLLLLVALVGAGAVLGQARATPLDAGTCGKLVVEHAALENAGVDENMAKGPEWGKANLPPEKIEEVRRFIELEELIQFRCRSKQRVVLPPDPEDIKDKEKDKEKAKEQAKSGKDKGVPGEAAAAAPAAKGGGPAAKADATAQPKAQPKKQESSAAPKAKPARQPARKRPAKAKVEEDDPDDDASPFGAPFDNAPQ